MGRWCEVTRFCWSRSAMRPIYSRMLVLYTGRGRFGTVFRGIWHGEVAVKMLDMDHGGTPENQINQLAAFKSEVRAAFESEVRAVLVSGAVRMTGRLIDEWMDGWCHHKF